MVRSLLRKIGAALVAYGSAPKKANKRGANPDDMRARFDELAQDLFSGRADPTAPLTASAIQLLGIKDIQAELGDAWDQVAARAYEVMERVIRRHVKSDDLFARKNDDTYILCFATLNKEQAARITRRIVTEIKEALLEEVPEAAKMEVGHHVTELAPSIAADGSGSLLDAIAASLEIVKNEAQEAYERQKRMLLAEASIVFAPAWSPSQQSIAVYRCLLDDWSSRSTMQTLETLAEPEALQRAIADLDFLILGRAIQTLHGILQSNSKTILLVPVNYHTLNQRKYRDEYLALCKKIPQSYRKFLLIEVYGIPSQTPTSRSLQVARMVQPYCHAIVVSVSPGTIQSMFEIGSNGIYGVALGLDEIGTSDARGLSRYIATARGAGLKVFAHGAKTNGLLRAAVGAGVDYIDGDAVAPKTDAPRSAYPWKMDLT